MRPPKLSVLEPVALNCVSFATDPYSVNVGVRYGCRRFTAAGSERPLCIGFECLSAIVLTMVPPLGKVCQP